MNKNSEINLKEHKIFFVGGKVQKVKDNNILKGKMYVESFIPAKSNNKNIILIHGGGQSGSGFITTADGRRGWLHDFLSHGYSVYVVDQPGRARSGYSSTLYGEYMDRETNIEDAERRFTAMAKKGNWPQAKLHNQWPGSLSLIHI